MEQLDARQAVHAEVSIEVGAEADSAGCRLASVKFGDQTLDDGQQLLGGGVIGRLRRSLSFGLHRHGVPFEPPVAVIIGAGRTRGHGVTISGKPTIEVEYCINCGFMLRAAWIAQELLRAFEDEVETVALKPGSGGVLIVRAGGKTLYSNKEQGGLPDMKMLKRRIAVEIGSGKSFGHDES
jgi:selenoprotein W-related protein